jgi:hypothetical protein
MTGFGFVQFREYFLCNFSETQKQQKTGNWHCGIFTKCNGTPNKWCKNKHGASKVIDTLETYQSPSSWEPQEEGMMSTAASFSLSKKPRFIVFRKKPNSRR